jgi:hypothetical protein
MTKKVIPFLTQPKLLPLIIIGKAGDTDFTFTVEIENWEYTKKKLKDKEFQAIYKQIEKAILAWQGKLESLEAISEQSVQDLLDSFDDEDLKAKLKTFFLQNIQGIGGLDIKLKDEETQEIVDTITSLTKEHEYFALIFDSLWAKDYNVTALCQRFKTFFAPNQA